MLGLEDQLQVELFGRSVTELLAPVGVAISRLITVHVLLHQARCRHLDGLDGAGLAVAVRRRPALRRVRRQPGHPPRPRAAPAVRTPRRRAAHPGPPARHAHLAPLARATARITERPLVGGNDVRGPALRRRRLSRSCSRAIAAARRSVALSSYILRDDAAGGAFIEALIARTSPRRAGAGADRRHRRRLFLVSGLPPAARGRGAGWPLHALAAAVAHAVPQPAHAQEDAGGRWPHRASPAASTSAPRTCWPPTPRTRARHPLPRRRPGGRPAVRGLRRGLAVRRPTRTLAGADWFPALADGRPAQRTGDHLGPGRRTSRRSSCWCWRRSPAPPLGQDR